MNAVREYLTMSGALASSGRVGVDVRAATRDALATAWQKRDASEALLARGLHAEAIRLGLESVTHLQRAAAQLRGAGLFADSGLRQAIDDVDRIAERLAKPDSLAALDARVPPEQRAALEHLLRAELSLAPRLGVLVLDRGGILELRRRRWLLAAVILATPPVFTGFVRRSVYGIDARASSAIDEEYAADRALDGDPSTEWVPNGGGDDWIELRFHRRSVHNVRLLNGDLLPDRAAHEVKFEFYLDNELRSSGHKSFDAGYPAEWLSFDAGSVRCDRVRIVITSHFGNGGALAEAQID
jgi:hypothetical protein